MLQIHVISGICNKYYWKQKDLFQHLECHKNDRLCDLCQENFCDWPEILSHRLKHVPENQRHCHLCSKYCISHIILEHHYRHMHYHGGVCNIVIFYSIASKIYLISFLW